LTTAAPCGHGYVSWVRNGVSKYSSTGATIAAVADGRHPVGVILSDGDKAWFATAPGAADDQDLTPEQVEHIMLDALAADSRPQWPDWHPLL
jgi:hypothetical protein